MKSNSELEALKADWKNDPCWDIEDTEGFEDHYEELKAYRIDTEKVWKDQCDRERFEEIDRTATELKCSMELAEYALFLEMKIDRLQAQLDDLRG